MKKALIAALIFIGVFLAVSPLAHAQWQGGYYNDPGYYDDYGYSSYGYVDPGYGGGLADIAYMLLSGGQYYQQPYDMRSYGYGQGGYYSYPPQEHYPGYYYDDCGCNSYGPGGGWRGGYYGGRGGYSVYSFQY